MLQPCNIVLKHISNILHPFKTMQSLTAPLIIATITTDLNQQFSDTISTNTTSFTKWSYLLYSTVMDCTGVSIKVTTECTVQEGVKKHQTGTLNDNWGLAWWVFATNTCWGPPSAYCVSPVFFINSSTKNHEGRRWEKGRWQEVKIDVKRYTVGLKSKNTHQGAALGTPYTVFNSTRMPI